MKNPGFIAIIFILSFTMFPAYGTEFSYKDFHQIVTSPNISTIPEALSKIPKEFRSSYTLMHNSESLQQSSPIFPRAILFGSTAQFVVTFNGHPDMRGYNALETVSYDTDKKRVYFRSVIFRSESKTREWTKSAVSKREGFDEDTEIEYFDDRVLVTKPNSMLCMACHSAQPLQLEMQKKQNPEDRLAKYNWPQYNRWNGAYGEDDDFIYPTEKSNFEKFKAIVKTHERYSFLENPRNDPSFPFHNNSANRFLGNMPNTRMTFLLSINYAKQIADIVNKTQWYQRNKYKILYELGRCSHNYELIRPLEIPEGFEKLNGYPEVTPAKIIDSLSGRLTLKRLNGFESQYSEYYRTPEKTFSENYLHELLAAQLIGMSAADDLDILNPLKNVNYPKTGLFSSDDKEFLKYLADSFIDIAGFSAGYRKYSVCMAIRDKIQK